MNLKFRIQNGIQLKTSFGNKKKFGISVGYLQPSADIGVINFCCSAVGLMGMAVNVEKEGGSDNGN